MLTDSLPRPPAELPLRPPQGGAAQREGPITILALIAHYVPAYKAGGPLRSLEHLVDQLGDPFVFRIITADRDWGDPAALPAVEAGRWVMVGKGEAIYLGR